MRRQMTIGSEGQTAAISQLMSQLRDSAHEHLTQTTTSLTETAEKVALSSHGVVANLERLADRLNNDEQHSQMLIGSINESIKAFQTMLSQSTGMVSEIKSVVVLIDSASKQLRSSSDLLTETSSSTQSALAQLSDGISKASQGCVSTNAGAFGRNKSRSMALWMERKLGKCRENCKTKHWSNIPILLAMV